MRKKFMITSMVVALSMSTLFGCSSDKAAQNTEAATTGETDAKNTADVVDTADMGSYDDEDFTRVLVADSEDVTAEDGVTVLKSTSENTISLNGDSVKSEVSGVNVDGTTVTITAPGTYILEGTLKDGQVIVDCQEKGTVELVFNNAEISNTTNSPVYVKDAKKVLMVLAENSKNTLSDAAEYTYDDTENEEPSACLFSKEDLVLCGGGSLEVTGNFNNGIASKDTLKITGGDITVTAKNNGIKGKDSLMIAGGTFNITAEGDALKSDNETDTTLGYVNISGGTFTLTAGQDGIQAETALLISDGTFTITTGSGAGEVSAASGREDGWDFDKRFSNTTTDTTDTEESDSIKGIKAGTAMTITGGEFTMDTEDDAFHSNGTFDLTGGTLTIKSGDDGIHADSTLTISDGTIDILQSYEGIESPDLIFNGGTTHIVASDDGTNAAGGSVDTSQGQSRGGMMGGSTGTMVINDGYIYINADGDGLDSNGDLTINGGVIVVEGPTDNSNTAVDYDGTFNMNGGCLLASGSSGMVENVSTSSTQNSVTYYYSSTLSAGNCVAITDADGNLVMAFENTKASQCFIFSDASLTTDETYTVYTGGTCDGTSKDGLYTDGTYNGGTELDSFTISSTVTSAGSGNNMGGMGGQMGGGNNGGGRGDMKNQSVGGGDTSDSSELPSDVPEDMTGEMPSDIPSGTPGEMPSDIPDGTPGEMPDNMTGDKPDNMPGDMGQNMPGGTQNEGTAETIQ